MEKGNAEDAKDIATTIPLIKSFYIQESNSKMHEIIGPSNPHPPYSQESFGPCNQREENGAFTCPRFPATFGVHTMPSNISYGLPSLPSFSGIMPDQAADYQVGASSSQINSNDQVLGYQVIPPTLGSHSIMLSQETVQSRPQGSTRQLNFEDPSMLNDSFM